MFCHSPSLAEISKKLNEVWKSVKDRETKQQIEAILDNLHELKQSAAALEDQNRELREKLRFKSDEYGFHTPFQYHKARPHQPLCVKCFSKGIEAPMGERGQDCSLDYRRCLVFGNATRVDSSRDDEPSLLRPDL